MLLFYVPCRNRMHPTYISFQNMPSMRCQRYNIGLLKLYESVIFKYLKDSETIIGINQSLKLQCCFTPSIVLIIILIVH
jgi:hypothetical protein